MDQSFNCASKNADFYSFLASRSSVEVHGKKQAGQENKSQTKPRLSPSQKPSLVSLARSIKIAEGKKEKWYPDFVTWCTTSLMVFSLLRPPLNGDSLIIFLKLIHLEKTSLLSPLLSYGTFICGKRKK